MLDKVMKGIHVFVIFFFSSILWLIGTLLGFIIVGFVPSTNGVLMIFEQESLFEDYSYKSIFKSYLKGVKQTFTLYRWKLLIPSFVFLILSIDFLIIRQNNLAQSLFQWPLIFLMAYLALVMISFLIQEKITDSKVQKNVKLALFVPLIAPTSFFMSVLLFLSFFILSLRYSLFAMIAIGAFFYVVRLILLRSFKKKGLIKN